MNIIDRIFGGGTVEQPTEVSSESNDVLDELAAEEERERKLQAESIARERRETAEYRARNKAMVAEFTGRMDPVILRINDAVAALLLDLPIIKQLVAEAHNVPWQQGGSIEALFGFPTDFPDRLLTAIRESAPRTEWNFDGTAPAFLGVKSGRPRLREVLLKMPTFRASGPSPGYSGTFNPLTGEPLP